MQTVHVVILVLYVLVMIGTGVWFTRRKKVQTGDDFVFAGRSLPLVVMVGTLIATWVGSGSIIGGASFAFSYGPLAAIVYNLGAPAGMVVLFFLARRIRASEAYTVPQILENRFGIPVRLVASAITLLAYVGITSYQFTGGGRIIALVTPLSPGEGAIVCAAVITFLALGGGLKSVAWSDFLSAVVIIASLIVALPIILGEVGGFSGWWEGLPDHAHTMSGGLTGVQLLGYFLPTFLLIISDQNMYQRLGAAKNPAEARKSMVGMFLASLLITVPIVLLATSSSVLQPNLTPDDAVLSLGSEGFLPTVLGGLLLAGALAFIITTGSSFLLSVAGNVVYDGFQRFSTETLDDRRRIRIHRVTILVIAAVAYVLGTYFPTVLVIQMYSYTVYGVALVPALFAGFFWRRATTAGVLTSMALGVVVTIGWEQLGRPDEVNSVIISLPVAVLALVLVSLVTRPARTLPVASAAATPTTESKEN
ncbi:sodium:solute symporter family protein [Georgenia alba]|uniref:Sodium:solute symporter n=1 Tax=Georgenia alba TaxID=2233858 RepID=A0ABW2Q292_9MICO